MADLVEALRAENAVLRERVRMLETALAPAASVPLEYGLTATETLVFLHLSSRDIATKESIMAVLYGTRSGDAPEIKIVDVFISKMRAKLAPYGVEIKTIWGRGYALTDRERFAGRSA